MYCKQCGRELAEGARFCDGCGAAVNEADAGAAMNKVNAGAGVAVNETSVSAGAAALYVLPRTERRQCEISVYPDRVDFNGKFLYLRDKDFYRPQTERESGRIRDFLGMSYLAMRSWKKTMLFVIAASVLLSIKSLVSGVKRNVRYLNRILLFFGESVKLPGWVSGTINVLAVICFLLAVVLFFSKKKVIEISFTDRRICIPQREMTAEEYRSLYAAIRAQLR